MFSSFEEFKALRQYAGIVESIKSEVPEDRQLMQLAEECAEGAQAALKLIRAYTGEENHLDKYDQRMNLISELADISVCMAVIMNDSDRLMYEEIYKQKLKRWRERLNGNKS